MINGAVYTLHLNCVM